ncbi:hypothetical protein H4K36_01470 [Streptomyces sp. DHE7-1]|nr:hypothetical protein [Streptomyces sp. DHE7-1]
MVQGVLECVGGLVGEGVGFDGGDEGADQLLADLGGNIVLQGLRVKAPR